MFPNRFGSQLFAVPLVVLLSAASGHAQSAVTAMPIPIPPDVKVTMEVDARQEDLLGLVKSLLKGMSAGGAQIGPLNENVGPPPASREEFLAQLLTGGRLEAILKNVNHVHFIMMTPSLGKPVGLRELYEEPLLAKGGHRIAWMDFDSNQLLVVGFDGPKGFEVAIQANGQLLVIRSDGFPDLEALAPLLKALMLGRPEKRDAAPPMADTTAENRPAKTPAAGDGPAG